MKKLILIISILTFLFSTFAWAQRETRGYFKRDGTYVQPYYSTVPNDTPLDNWSTKGNYNPYTGKPGYHDPNPPLDSLTPYQPSPPRHHLSPNNSR